MTGTVLVIGLSGLIAQVLLLRELLVGFYGNELTLGVILANWLLLEACGTFFTGRYLEKNKNSTHTFLSLQILFLLSLPFSLYLARSSKVLLGIPFGQGLGLSAIFYLSFFVLLPVSFSHGALFSVACKMQSAYARGVKNPIGKVYALETIGTMLGGLFFTYLFIPYFSSFQIAFMISLINLMLCFIFFKPASKIFQYLILFTLVVTLFFSTQSRRLENISIAQQFPGQEVKDSRNSVYGNIAVTKRGEQYTFFYNGLPIITTPYPDITFMQEFASLPLLFHPQPKEILIIGAGAGGLVNEVLKHPINKLDYAELDPLVITMLKKYPSVLTQRELSDQRVKIVYQDGRYFINTTANKYDVLLIGLSRPSDLSVNRLFTQEFFSLAKKRLAAEGILALYLPGSLTYLSRPLKDLNACILNGLKKVYAYVRIIPGDYNIFLASDSQDLISVNAEIIKERMLKRDIKAGILVPAYLGYRLDKKWVDWFNNSLAGATQNINRDSLPFAVYQMLIIWNRQFSPAFSFILESLKNIKMSAIFIFILLFTCALAYLFLRNPKDSRPAIAYCIATTGFFAMLANLILIFSFQIAYGYLYQMIGLLTSIFMAGIACGSIVTLRNISKIRDKLRVLLGLEAAILIFSLILAVALGLLVQRTYYAWPVFTLLFLFCGILVGIEFPLASEIYLKEKREIAEAAGLLYAADLIGGCLAGILGGIVLLPLLGLLNTCLIVAFFKISSLVLFIFSRQEAQNSFDRG